MNPKNLYLLTTNGLGEFYLVAENPNDAKEKLELELNKSDYGFSGKRKVENIKILASEIKVDHNDGDKLNFSSDDRLLICK